jgi:site-specific DNA recombinase
MVAIGYARQSDKDSSANSIASQCRRIESYCETNKLSLIKTFIDDGKSGWTFDRPAFIELEKFCKANSEVKFLIVPHFDRFSRTDPIDAMAKERYFRDKLGVKVLQVTESADIDTNDPTFALIRFIQAFTSNQERRRIVERALHGAYDRLSQGYYCGMAPFGYVNNRSVDKEKIITINEKQALAVRVMFKAYVEGAPFKYVLKLGSELGYRNKGNGNVQRLLRNPVYAGMVRVPAYKGKPSLIVKAKHPPIISENMYWRAQEQLDLGQKYVKHLKEEVYLRGVLRCNICGRVLTAGNSKGKYRYYWYYICVEHKENFSAIRCHDQFQDLLAHLSFKGKELAYIKAKTAEKIRDFLRQKERNLVVVKRQLQQVQETIAVTEERYLLQPDISAAVYTKVIRSLKIEESGLQNRMAELTCSDQVFWEKHDLIMSSIGDVQGAFNRFSIVHRHRFIRAVFDNALSYAEGVYRTPFLHSLFRHNELILKDKRLLFVEQPVIKIGENLRCARDEIRTHTPFRALPPQSSASTNFATHAAERLGIRCMKISAYPAKR